jgi:hypothetical protein
MVCFIRHIMPEWYAVGKSFRYIHVRTGQQRTVARYCGPAEPDCGRSDVRP